MMAPATIDPMHRARKAIMIFLAEGRIITMPAAHDREGNTLANPDCGPAAPRQPS
jgi:hypothetical protein